MKRLIVLLLFACSTLTLPQATTIASGAWSNPAVWALGTLPDSLTDVVIGAGHTITVSVPNAMCRSISFADTAAHLDMNANAMLSVYGDFSIFSNDHNVFAPGWSSTNAVVRFAGGAFQQIKNFRHLGASSSFRDLLIDKYAGAVATDTVNNLTLGVQNLFEIRNGEFILWTNDDIEGRYASSVNLGAELQILVGANGAFTMKGGSSHVRRTTNNDFIGSLTVFGQVQLTTSSTNRLNFNNVVIGAGGRVQIISGFSSARFNPDTLFILPGGTLRNTITTNVWVDSCNVILEPGGVFETTSSTTAFPLRFINNGTVRYSRNVSTLDQTIADMDYYRLELSFANGGLKKNWALGGNRVIRDSLEINNSAQLVLTAAAPQTVSVEKLLRLTSGSINNTSPNANISMAPNAVISRATGQLQAAPLFAGNISLRYTSSVASVVTGFELPAADIITDLQVFSTDQTVTLNANAKVNGTLTLSAGTFDNNGADDSKVLTLGAGAILRRATGTLTTAPVVTGGANLEYISTVSEVTTALEVPAAGIVNNLTVSGSKGVRLGKNIAVNGQLAITGSNLITDSNTVTLNSGALLTESNGAFVFGTVLAQRSVAQNTLENFSGIGLSLNAAGGAPGVTTVRRVNVPRDSIFGLNRHFLITASNNSGLNAQLTYAYATADLRGFREENLALYRSTNNGATWVIQGGAVDTAANSITLAGVASLSEWTASDKTNPLSADEPSVPAAFQVISNYPNPFNPETTLRFRAAAACLAALTVYDVLGNSVASLFNGPIVANTQYQVALNASGLASGVYVAVLNTPLGSSRVKMLLTK